MARDRARELGDDRYSRQIRPDSCVRGGQLRNPTAEAAGRTGPSRPSGAAGPGHDEPGGWRHRGDESSPAPMRPVGGSGGRVEGPEAADRGWSSVPVRLVPTDPAARRSAFPGAGRSPCRADTSGIPFAKDMTMLCFPLRKSSRESNLRPGAQALRRRRRVAPGLESMEGRVLLSTLSTLYDVTSTSGSASVAGILAVRGRAGRRQSEPRRHPDRFRSAGSSGPRRSCSVRR